MRLLNVHTGELSEFVEDIPPYAVTSHRWLNRGKHKFEVEYEEYVKGTGREKPGFSKIMNFCQAAKNVAPGIDWIWMDTCCINQPNLTEYAESILSMYRWYKEAAICLAYLHDVPYGANNWPKFFASEWFKRGWTLQELLAPSCVVFFSQEWQLIGHKAGDLQSPQFAPPGSPVLGFPINNMIVQATGIPDNVLRDVGKADLLSFDERQGWMRNRRTTKVEDMAYCQMGLFDIFLPIMYGTRGKPLEQLRHKIEKKKKKDMPAPVQVYRHSSPPPQLRPDLDDSSSDPYDSYSSDSSDERERFRVGRMKLFPRLRRKPRRLRREDSPPLSRGSLQEVSARNENFSREHQARIEQNQQTALKNQEQIREQHEQSFRDTQERMWQMQQPQPGNLQQQTPVQQFPIQQTPFQQVSTNPALSQQRVSQQYEAQQVPTQQFSHQPAMVQQRPIQQVQQQTPIHQFQDGVIRYY